MLVGFSFEAKPGKAKELEALLSDPERARAMAQALGATRNVLFWQGDRMIRMLEFPEGTTPPPMGEVAERDPEARAFLARVGELAEPGFDVDDPASLEAFSQAANLRLLYDVSPDPS